MGVEMQNENHKSCMNRACVEWEDQDGKELRKHTRTLWESHK